ncbi:hypothetical protein ACFV3F_03595 [Streptomyces sp. NPDC059717]|uniref:hypothetical protein n=1 Tax=Streptomyces sp. NPDC059717 TaxID=3346922 RepID=UPI0036B885CF
MGLLSWLGGGNDRQLADSQYSGRESATDRAARKRRIDHRTKGARRAAAAGDRWEQKDRRKFGDA